MTPLHRPVLVFEPAGLTLSSLIHEGNEMNVLLSYLLLTATTLPDLGGEWDTTFGRLVVEQSEVAVTGRYPLGVMTGTVEGRRVLFTYDERDAKGEGSFELSADGASFGGQWRARVGDGWSEWSEWSGVRVELWSYATQPDG